MPLLLVHPLLCPFSPHPARHAHHIIRTGLFCILACACRPLGTTPKYCFPVASAAINLLFLISIICSFLTGQQFAQLAVRTGFFLPNLNRPACFQTLLRIFHQSRHLELKSTGPLPCGAPLSRTSITAMQRRSLRTGPGSSGAVLPFPGLW